MTFKISYGYVFISLRSSTVSYKTLQQINEKSFHSKLSESRIPDIFVVRKHVMVRVLLN